MAPGLEGRRGVFIQESLPPLPSPLQKHRQNPHLFCRALRRSPLEAPQASGPPLGSLGFRDAGSLDHPESSTRISGFLAAAMQGQCNESWWFVAPCPSPPPPPPQIPCPTPNQHKCKQQKQVTQKHTLNTPPVYHTAPNQPLWTPPSPAQTPPPPPGARSCPVIGHSRGSLSTTVSCVILRRGWADSSCGMAVYSPHRRG